MINKREREVGSIYNRVFICYFHATGLGLIPSFMIFNDSLY